MLCHRCNGEGGRWVPDQGWRNKWVSCECVIKGKQPEEPIMAKHHPSHKVRSSMDASTYDEICEECSATDAPGNVKLSLPCPGKAVPVKPQDPVPGNGVRCKGCWSLGNNCGECDYCKETCHEALGIIKHLQKQIRQLMNQKRINELEAEIAKLKGE